MVVVEKIVLKTLGRVDYEPAVKAMREFTAGRGPDTPDELWLLEHPPVYTLGLGAGAGHGPRAANGIPVVKTERGGEITYHGPGQLVMYTLVDLARRGIKVKQFVQMLESSLIELLGRGETRRGAPGVYVGGAKIAALGIRVARGCAYHGVALNVCMDLSPFSAIDPCGYPGLAVTQMRDLGISESTEEIGNKLAQLLVERLERA